MNVIAGYLRISVKDQKLEKESNSIQNQRILILRYIKTHFSEEKYQYIEFVDDGFSGTNMFRPGMIELMYAVKNHKIQCIIVKDMSRFSRDYLQMGKFLNQIFPLEGIRFISINDAYDSKISLKQTIELDVAFQTLLYDLYSKDLSEKVKASMKSKCHNGEYPFAKLPFGYEKKKDDKSKIVVNEKEARIVRFIYDLALQGNGVRSIVRILYKNRIPTIMEMRKENMHDKLLFWNEGVVRRILNNRFYIGEMVYGKTVRKFVGDLQGKVLPKEEWNIIKNHHEHIISKEIFDQVSNKSKRRSIKDREDTHPLLGKVYCGVCGYKMQYKYAYGNKGFRRFECGKHARIQNEPCCTYVNAEWLENKILCMIHEIIKCNDFQKNEKTPSSILIEREIEKQEKILKKERIKKEVLYEQYACFEISENVYKEGMKQVRTLCNKIKNQKSKFFENSENMENEVFISKEDFFRKTFKGIDKKLINLYIHRIQIYKGNLIEVDWKSNVKKD